MTIRLLGTLALAASMALAQTNARPGARQNVDALKTYLGLSDSQVESLKQVRENARNEAKPLQDTLGQKATTLREHQRNGTGDAATLGQLMVDMRETRKQLEPIRARAQEQAMNVLTPDQRTKLEALQNAARSRRELRQARGLGLLGGGASQNGAGPRARFRGQRL